MGGSNKRDKDSKMDINNGENIFDNGDTGPKKNKKHKHKRSKSSKKDKKRQDTSGNFAVDFENDVTSDNTDLQLEEQSGGSLDLEIGTDGEIIVKLGKNKGEGSKFKKSKKKSKDKGDGKSGKKDRKSTSKKDTSMITDSDAVIGSSSLPVPGSSAPNRKEASRGAPDEDGTDSEEERWLHAIESGKLEEVDDELKRIRNPRLLTARQRALQEKQCAPRDDDENTPAPEGVLMDTDDFQPIIPPEPLLALPSGFKEKVVTQEMLEKKAIKSQRRREQALEKREEDKKKTVDRLLKKQDSKLLKSGLNKKVIKADVAMFCYRNTQQGVTLSLPTGCDFPIAPQQERAPLSVKLCGVAGCGNPKRYSCSQTSVPVCSLQCYKANLAVTSHQPAAVV